MVNIVNNTIYQKIEGRKCLKEKWVIKSWRVRGERTTEKKKKRERDRAREKERAEEGDREKRESKNEKKSFLGGSRE